VIRIKKTKNKKQKTKNKKQETKNKKQKTKNKEQRTKNKEQKTKNDKRKNEIGNELKERKGQRIGIRYSKKTNGERMRVIWRIIGVD
jgi:hypothetical protein